MKRMIILNQNQFGYLNDTYYYCKYLRYDFDLTYLCWFYNYKKIHLNKIRIYYVSRSGNVVVRNIRYILRSIFEIKKNHYDIHFIKYFSGCSLLKLFCPTKKFILDIRTGSVNNKSKLKRKIYNKLIYIESKVFKNITIISESLRNRLNISKHKTFILPVGGDIISETNKLFTTMQLLYVGTFNNRNIEKTIIGFHKFYEEYKNLIDTTYTIIGSGNKTEFFKIKETINKLNISSVVRLVGYKDHESLKKYFDQANIGVSHIPITEYFDCQPPTKTFEYLLSGLCVIGTNTTENKKIINNSNGVLINDDPLSFYNGLIHLYNNMQSFNSRQIANNILRYKWSNIILNYFKMYLYKII